jgi:hypothetical protein
MISMHSEEPIILEIPLEIAGEDVWGVLGSKDRVHDKLKDEVSEAVDTDYNIATPKAVFRTINVLEVGSNFVKLESDMEIRGKFISHLFGGAEKAIFIAATMGAELDRKISQLMENGDNIEAVILDSAGTAAAFNGFTHVLNYLMTRALPDGWKMGTCLRPGQTYWDITGQAMVFKALPAHLIGMELLESSFMKPQKSQSGIVPIGSQLHISSDPSQGYCKYCPASNCPMRIEPFIEIVN